MADKSKTREKSADTTRSPRAQEKSPEPKPQQAWRLVALGRSGPASVLQLQRAIGNRAATRVLDAAGRTGPPAPPLQRRGGAGGFVLDEQTAARIRRARGGGQALSGPVRETMSSALGYDFGGVRVHTGSEADRLNRRLGSRAFAAGPDIYFRRGAYDPASPRGRELLAHELHHVVQQGTGRVKGAGGGITVRPADDPLEREAQRSARSLQAQEREGTGPTVFRRSNRETIQKAGDGDKEEIPEEAQEESFWKKLWRKIKAVTKAVGEWIVEQVGEAIWDALEEAWEALGVFGSVIGFLQLIGLYRDIKRERGIYKRYAEEARKESVSPDLSEIMSYGEKNSQKRYRVAIMDFLKGLGNVLLDIAALIFGPIGILVDGVCKIVFAAVAWLGKQIKKLIDWLKGGEKKRRKKGEVVLQAALGFRGTADDKKAATRIMLDLHLPFGKSLERLWDQEGLYTRNPPKEIDVKSLGWLAEVFAPQAKGDKTVQDAKDELIDGVAESLRGYIW